MRPSLVLTRHTVRVSELDRDDDRRPEMPACVRLRRRRDVFAVHQVAVQVGRAPHARGQLAGCQVVLGDVARGDLAYGGGRARLAVEFGIFTAPRAVVDGPARLPRKIYDMPEFLGLEDWGYESSDA